MQVGQIQVTLPSASCWLLHASPAVSSAVRASAHNGQVAVVSMGSSVRETPAASRHV